MKYQEFEGKLKNTFHNTESPVDIDVLIAGIHAAKPRRNLNWLWFGLFCLLSVAGVVGLDRIISNNHAVVENHDLKSISNTSTMGTERAASDVAKTADERQATAAQSSGHNAVATASATFEKETPPSSISTDNATASKSASYQTVSTVTTEFRAADQDMADKNKRIIASHISSSPTASRRAAATSNSKAQTNSTSTTSTSIRHNLTESAPTLKTSLSVGKEVASISMLPSVGDELTTVAELPFPKEVECPTFKKGMVWHIDLIPEVGFIAPLKSLTTNNTEPTESFLMRSADETPLEGLQAALYGRLRAGSAPYYLKLGVSYTRISERMNLDVSYTRSDTTVGIISITESQNGDTLTVIRGDIITDTMYRRQSVDHYFLHMIDIPAAIGYSKSIGSGWRIGGEVGAQLNIGLSTKGKLLETADSYTDLPASGRFAANVGLSFFGGITFEKAISTRGAIYFSPRFRYFPRAFTPDSYGIRQEYQFVGIHAGYIHSF